MKKIDLLLIKSFIGPFILTFFIALFVFVMQFLWKYIDDLVGKGLDIKIIAELLFYTSANLVPMALPLAILLASIMVFGNLGEHFELVALKSSGISLIRIMRGLFYTVCILAILAFLFSNFILPKANLKYGVLLYDIRNKQPAFDISEGIFYNGIKGYSIKVGKKHKDNKTLEDVIIYDHTKGRGNINVLIAEKAEMFINEDGNSLSFNLYNGKQYEEGKKYAIEQKNDKYEHNYTSFKSYIKVFDMSGFAMKNTKEDLFRKNHQMLNIWQLDHFIDSLENDKVKKQYVLANHCKNYLPFSPSYITEIDSVTKIRSKKARSSTAKSKNSDKITAEKEAEKELNNLVASKNKTISNKKERKQEDSTDQKVRLLNKENIKPFLPSIKKPQINKEDLPDIGSSEKIKPQKKEDNIINLEEYASLMESFPKKERAKIASRAVNFARNIKGYTNVSGRELRVKNSSVNRYKIAWHTKFTLSFACIVLFFIGAPLGAVTKKGGLGMPMILSISFFVIYHLLNTFGKKFAQEYILSPFEGIWLSSIILGFIGAILTIYAMNDSQLKLGIKNFIKIKRGGLS